MSKNNYKIGKTEAKAMEGLSKAIKMGTLNNKCRYCGKVFTCEYEQNTASFFFANACDICPKCYEARKDTPC